MGALLSESLLIQDHKVPEHQLFRYIASPMKSFEMGGPSVDISVCYGSDLCSDCSGEPQWEEEGLGGCGGEEEVKDP